MKHDRLLNKLQAASLVASVLCASACSQAPETAAPGKKSTHVWSDQVDALHEAKEVAGYAQDVQTLKEERMQDRR